jgi:hypothetical protein
LAKTKKMMTTQPAVHDRNQVTHRLACHTCLCETTVATGELHPAIVEMFNYYHPLPHHVVVDERLGYVTKIGTIPVTDAKISVLANTSGETDNPRSASDGKRSEPANG